MRFPFVSRHIYEQVLQERNRLLDKLMQQTYGFQLHDSFTEHEPTPEMNVGQVETKPEPAQETEEEIQAREKAELISVRRTRPSSLATKLEQIARARLIRRAQAANPGNKMDVKAHFEQLKSEVLKSKTVH